MTHFIKLENNEPVGEFITEENFRQMFPQFPDPTIFVADDVEPLGYGIFDFSTPPPCAWNEKPAEQKPVKNEFGIWRQTWAVVPKAPEEMPPPMPQDGQEYIWVEALQEWVIPVPINNNGPTIMDMVVL